jgi:hypothetical protein
LRQKAIRPAKFNHTSLLICQIENIIAKTQHFETLYRLTNSSMEDSLMINGVLSEAFKQIEHNKCIANKKEVRKILNNLKDTIQQLSLTSLNNIMVRKLVDEIYNPNNEEQSQDFYSNKFKEFVDDTLEIKANSANEILEYLKSFYADFEIEFEVVEDKIKELGGGVERLKNNGGRVN